MSSKSKHSFLRTVKFKLLLTYTVVFAALASAGFLAAYSAIRNHLYGEIDRGLEVRSRRMEARYALGEGVDDDEEMILPDRIPAAVLAGVKQRVPGMTVVQAKVERKRKGGEVRGDRCYR